MFSCSQGLKGNGPVSVLVSQQLQVRLRPHLLLQAVGKGPHLPLAHPFHLHHRHPSEVRGRKCSQKRFRN